MDALMEGELRSESEPGHGAYFESSLPQVSQVTGPAETAS